MAKLIGYGLFRLEDIHKMVGQLSVGKGASWSLLASLEARLSTLGQQLTHHFDQLDARLERLEQQLAELQRARTSAPPQGRPHLPAPRARIAAPAPATHSTPTAAPPKPTVKKRGKRKAKARKKLPSMLVPLSTFRQLHHVTAKAVEIAVQKHKLAVVRGAWVYQHHPIAVALDRQGQQQFLALLHQREGFQRCNNCPH